jgi:phosphohistidine swiveling domain-containing protein
MEGNQMTTMVRSFREFTMGEHLPAGGKGGTLARLCQTGYPVPDGFVILPSAFAGDELTAEGWAQVQTHLGRMRQAGDGAPSFAVRSSALPAPGSHAQASEDSAHASFAGGFETVLDVRNADHLVAAIRTVRRSRHAERVRAYSEAMGLDAAHDMAVIVQRLIRADISGLLFTRDPVTGSHTSMMGNFVFGLGEPLVSGEAKPFTFTLKRPRGQYDGPPALQRFARGLYRLASRLEGDLGCPQDIEWAIADGKLFLLQARPITTLIGHNPATGEWNDSLTGDYMWSNANLTEAVPDVMTPLTWSMWQIFHKETAFTSGEYPGVGNICGRPYGNVSLAASLYTTLGKDLQGALQEVEGTMGRIPEDMDIPFVPISRFSFLLGFLPALLVRLRKARQVSRDMPEYIASTPEWCSTMQQQIDRTTSKTGLLRLWRAALEPYYYRTCWMLRVSAKLSVDFTPEVQRKLARLVGEADANALLLHLDLDSDSGFLASLGPVVGVARVACGEMSRDEYLELHGHRGPHEMELSFPRPAEDPGWLDQLLVEFAQSPVDVDAMLARRRTEFEVAWQRFEDRHPGKVKSIRRLLVEVAQRTRTREAVRSEVTRVVGIVRAFALRAGELTGIGDGIFFLCLEELLDVLSGDESAAAYLPARRETHTRYSALPPYPGIISGRFHPFEWAADPNRRTDLFDSHTLGDLVPDSDTVTGFAGAAGRVEGLVRRLDTAEESKDLQPGEILVTSTTNIGWTPLFPRAAAIITDVGAPLSHAAIVARELGIPAVVGCGDATMRLSTGDRVRVDGGQGVVQILEPANA